MFSSCTRGGERPERLGEDALDVREELLTIAEIAIGIAGFAGVVAAFLYHEDSREVDRVRFITLFSMAFSTIVLSYVPIVVFHLGYAGESLWARASGVMVAAWFFNSAFALRILPRLAEVEPYYDMRWTRTIMIVPSLSNLAVQILNAGGWLWTPGFLGYLFGLFAYLYAAAMMFVYIVLYRPGPSS
jgi:hypothetical protein